MITASTSLGGNFMINFGPKGDGSLRDEELHIADEVGKWMGQYGDAIYGCEAAGLPDQKWGYYTMNKKNNKVYMVVLNQPLNSELRVKLPAGIRLTEASHVGDKTMVPIKEVSKGEYYVHVERNLETTQPYVIEITLKQGIGEAEGNYIAPKT